MKYNSIEAFVPSGRDFQKSRALFIELGFTINWETNDLIGFENYDVKFILQKYAEKSFAENFMLSVRVDNLDEFWAEISSLNLAERFDIKLQPPKNFPWGREVNMIDIAGVCWHFAETKR